jgi:hypothetical protein
LAERLAFKAPNISYDVMVKKRRRRRSRTKRRRTMKDRQNAITTR